MNRADKNAARHAALEDIGRQLMRHVAPDPDAPAVRQTPARWARWWMEFLDYDPGSTETVFASATTDQMVVVKGIRVWSLCEHHLLPFWCDVTIGCLVGPTILGLSKFARIAHARAHALQVQERLVTQIAGDVSQAAGTPNVAVIASGVHLCMAMRGIKSDATMISSAMLGEFRADAAARAEFLALAGFSR